MKKTLLALMLLLLPGWIEAANTIYINGEMAQEEAVKISFSGDSALITFRDNTEMTVDMSTLKVIFVTEDAIEKTDITPAVYVVNTLVEEILSLSGIETETKATIMDLSGRIYISKVLDKQDGRLDVSSLSAGVYLLKMNNQVIKFVKK